ncbi:MAG: hypothetical protein HYU41_03930 [Candidatus Rokubacteria bacterium]|nr:hypothetical protein [Candidatus Rokubacteria bacterium]
MGTPKSRLVEHQRLALDFMLDTLGLRPAYEEISWLPETQALQEAVAALELDDVMREANTESNGGKP